MTTIAEHNNFVRRVRAEMTTQELSIRALARRMDPENLNRARRNLHRWLDEGITPSRASRAEVAVALGIPESELDPDDEEADQLMAPLVRAIRDLVRAEVRQAVEA